MLFIFGNYKKYILNFVLLNELNYFTYSLFKHIFCYFAFIHMTIAVEVP